MDERPGAQGASPPPDGPSEAGEYQPPAIAWEEPLEAMAATSCLLTAFDGDCGFSLNQG
jgi:hypothetical protein